MSPSAVVPGVKGEEDVVLTDVEPDPQLRPEPPVLGEDEPVGGQGEADVVALLLLSGISLNNVAIAFPVHILQIDPNLTKGSRTTDQKAEQIRTQRTMKTVCNSIWRYVTTRTYKT